MNDETKVALKSSNFIEQYQQTIEAIYRCRVSTIKLTCNTGPRWWYPLVIVTQKVGWKSMTSICINH